MEASATSPQNTLEEYSSPPVQPHHLSTGSSTMAELLLLTVAKNAERPAATFHDGEQWHTISYAELGADVRAVAKGLIANGIGRGDFVSILSNTRLEWTVADFAALCAGAIVAPVYPTNSPEECEYLLNHAESKVLFVENGEQLAKIGEVRDQLKHLKLIVVFDPDVDDLADAITLEELREQGRTLEDQVVEDHVAAVQPEDLCTIVYTSGTTGPPKGCMITHENFRNTTTMAASIITSVDEQNGERAYLFLPLAHVFARTTQFLNFDLGGELSYWRGDTQLIVPDMVETKPESLPAVPRIFEKIYSLANGVVDSKTPEEQAQFHKAIEVGLEVRQLQDADKDVPAELLEIFERADEAVYNNVRQLFGGQLKRAITGSAPIAKEILEFFYACGIPVFEGYGMTETSTLTSANVHDAYRFGSIGRPVGGVTVRIADDGEILVRGKNIFQGYYKEPEATAETIDPDGWLHTGDLGYIDSDGYIFINGRKKDIIITAGGKNLTPANWENAMKQSRWISEAVMFGDRKPYPTALVTLDGEEAAALRAELGIADDVTLHDNEQVIVLVNEINAEVNKKFARVEQVKKLAILDHEMTIETGELTPSLKVKRSVVHERYADVYEALYAS